MIYVGFPHLCHQKKHPSSWPIPLRHGTLRRLRHLPGAARPTGTAACAFEAFAALKSWKPLGGQGSNWKSWLIHTVIKHKNRDFMEFNRMKYGTWFMGNPLISHEDWEIVCHDHINSLTMESWENRCNSSSKLIRIPKRVWAQWDTDKKPLVVWKTLEPLPHMLVGCET